MNHLFPTMFSLSVFLLKRIERETTNVKWLKVCDPMDGSHELTPYSPYDSVLHFYFRTNRW